MLLEFILLLNQVLMIEQSSFFPPGLIAERLIKVAEHSFTVYRC